MSRDGLLCMKKENNDNMLQLRTSNKTLSPFICDVQGVGINPYFVDLFQFSVPLARGCHPGRCFVGLDGYLAILFIFSLKKGQRFKN